MSMKMVSSAISIGVMALLAGCGNQEADPVSSASSNDAGGEQKSYVFGVIAKAQANPVFQAARTGAEAAARELSEKHEGITVEINWRTPATDDAQKQAEFVELLTSQGVDGIAISCSDANLLTSALSGSRRGQRPGCDI